MSLPHNGYDRRTVLKAVGAAAVGTATAGCLSSADEAGTVLPPPENYDRRQDLDLPFPDYGEEIPEITVPAPLQDRDVTTTEFIGERHTMYTFVYTTCTTVCGALAATLQRVQIDSIESGYADEMAFLPMTFDPEVDTADVIREYEEGLGVAEDAGNWYFLRPEDSTEAEQVVDERFGVAFEGDGGHYQHTSLVLLVNKDGIVERAYNGDPPRSDIAISDATTVVEEW
ncbi:SCO1/SenC/PrrC family protein [Natronomonas pharaonis DSM 2160]|uniref:SCO1/SenC/PrrC family protein n=1 Tax=Natronomonas pharaonis (strain ATCC 35678 / DSM 2160 / CIP 103997 / JCM 8858 / NBRC 14720 / NCIMB 2260 / Gabara) TaxID=348780 RepID=A0A1U7EV55_NATPD|nr:SCO family protein [Natronomonas pharaonis]CAI48893.1 SCO1/SenC/PrrC family protein [Natronomonas pharaonis DSM 2160]